MKREAWDHPKFKLLARDLGLPLCYARGIVESIWLVAQISMPGGDLGRWSNDEIAIAIDYPGDADALIAALLKRRLIDACPTHRLIIHDWPEHADALIHRRLARGGQNFADGTAPNLKQCTPGERKQYEEHRKNPARDPKVYTTNIRSSPAVSGIERGIGTEKEPSSAANGDSDGVPVEPRPDELAVVVISPTSPPPDPHAGEASRLIGTLNRSHEINRKDRVKVSEMIRKFGVDRVAEAFAECNTNDALKPIPYASTILSNQQATENARGRGPPSKHPDEQPFSMSDEKILELEKAGLL